MKEMMMLTALRSVRTHVRLFMAVLTVSAVFGAHGAGIVQAATLTVTTTADSGPGSLRQAIADAAAGDTIRVTATGTILLTTGQLSIDKPVIIDGPGASQLTISGGGMHRVFEVFAQGAVTIQNLSIKNGTDQGDDSVVWGGGGIHNGALLTIRNCVVADNFSTAGGGILVFSGSMLIDNCVVANNLVADNGYGGGVANHGYLDVRNSVIRGNVVFGHGGGIYSDTPITISDTSIEGNHGLDGGGLYAFDPVTVTRSTFTGNVAARRGGGLHVWAYFRSDATVTNTTFSGNRAQAGGGLSVYNVQNGRTLVSSSTFVGNSASSGAGLFAVYPQPGVSIKNSVFADGGTGGNLYLPAGSATFDGVNFSTDASASGLGVVEVALDALKLGPLAQNGGPTLTHALLAGSVAIDSAADCTDWAGQPVATDQRGVARPQGLACDAGAFERGRFAFSGFFAPVDNLPTLNLLKAGSSVPVKFSLGGDQGLNVFAAGSPQAPAVPCTPGAPTDSITEVVSAGKSGLSYDPVTMTYTYVWKTDKAWANTCRELQVTLTDGSVHKARFQFSK